MARTGIFRVRKGFFGGCVLQEFHQFLSMPPVWIDVPYNAAPTTYKAVTHTSEESKK